VFEPFFTTKGDKGTGLGLATVYGIVKQSGGHLSVYSEPGHGTSFRLWFPRLDSESHIPESAEAALPLGGRETVLLCEDEVMVRQLVRTVLEMQGYTVLEASDGASALRAAAEHTGPIHLLLTDVVMPGGMSGKDVAEQISALRPDVKILFMSGYTDDAIVHHGVLEEGTAFIHKPFVPTALARKVREVLD
jgi:CheY-like chemotaxis protein